MLSQSSVDSTLRYARLAELTRRMAVVASSGDFESLSKLSEDYTELIKTIPTESVTLSTQEIIFAQEILQNQKTIREIADPWLEHVRVMLRDNRTEQVLLATYRKTP